MFLNGDAHTYLGPKSISNDENATARRHPKSIAENIGNKRIPFDENVATGMKTPHRRKDALFSNDASSGQTMQRRRALGDISNRKGDATSKTNGLGPKPTAKKTQGSKPLNKNSKVMFPTPSSGRFQSIQP